MIHFAAVSLLRRHVRYRSESSPLFRQKGPAVEPRHAEISYLRLAPGIEHDICRLDVAVDDILPVRFGEPCGNLHGDVDRLLEGQRAIGDLFPEALAFYILHRDERLSVLLVDLEDRTDIRMIESGGRLRLADEAFPGLLVTGELPGKKLERYGAAQLRILRPVDDAHPAPAELLDDPVM